MLFFTSDEHYFHRNIIGYENRPYQHVDEMNQDLVHKFNSVVRPNDETWHLGDFMMADNPDTAWTYWSRLNGRHHFIEGNHDKWLKRFMKKYGPECLPGIKLELHPPLIEIKHEGQRIVLCHYALRTWRGVGRGTWMLYGHSHGNLKDVKGKTMDVGVDPQGGYPISFNKIKEIMDNQIVEVIDHHEFKS